MTYSKMMFRAWCIIAVLLALQTASCISPLSMSFTCSDIEQTPLRALDYGVDDPTTVLKKVADKFRLQQTDITYEPYYEDPNSGVAVWNASIYGTYNAMFRNEVLTNVNLFFNKNLGPSIQQVLNCLGEPDKYRAVYRPDVKNQFNLSLWYPDKGIVVTTYEFGGSRPPAITSNAPIRMLSVQEPGSIEAMIIAEYGYLHQDLLQSLKAWPGSLEQIVVDNLLLK